MWRRSTLKNLLNVYSKRPFSEHMNEVPRHLRNALNMLQDVDLTLAQVPFAGRGLFANEAIKQGTRVHAEKPMVCYPSLSQVCHHCLKPVACQHASKASNGSTFCSTDCHTQALQQYFAVEQLLDLTPLQQHCEAHDESFPMLVLRAGCQHLQHAMTLSQATVHSKPEIISTCKTVPQGDIWQDYKFLTFARIPPPPPPPWVDAHGLLQHAVQGYVQKQTPKLTHAQRNTLDAALADLSLEWYIDLLSRLHINTFRQAPEVTLHRVDGVPNPQFSVPGQGLSLADMAAAAVTGSQEGRLGTAIYLVASLFNHSCAPNVDVTFPFNNSTAVFVAARDIEQAEELCISYIDASRNVAARRQQLQWAYGFTCQCHLCVEELQSADN